MKNKINIFDKLIHLPVINLFRPFYIKHKGFLLYLIFGGLSFFLNFFLFIILNSLNLNEHINNIICWLICVLFQFYTNRTWVFDGQVDSSLNLIKQMGQFFLGRLVTLAIEELILAIFISYLGMNPIIIKLLAQIVVIVLNYIISKLVVFKT